MKKRVVRSQDFAPLDNVQRFNAAMSNLKGAAEQMLLVYGPPGMGKTTTAAFSYIKQNGLLITCLTGLTQKSLLHLLLREFGIVPRQTTNAQMLIQVIELLGQDPRPLFIDEADRLFENKRLFESIRDIHDQAQVPVIMLGASSAAGFVGVDQHLRRYPQLADRIAHWVQFTPATKRDFGLLQGVYCPGVQLSEGLAARILSNSSGNIRKIRIGLKNCQLVAQRKNTSTLSESDFGRTDLIVEMGQRTQPAEALHG